MFVHARLALLVLLERIGRNLGMSPIAMPLSSEKKELGYKMVHRLGELAAHGRWEGGLKRPSDNLLLFSVQLYRNREKWAGLINSPMRIPHFDFTPLLALTGHGRVRLLNALGRR